MSHEKIGAFGSDEEAAPRDFPEVDPVAAAGRGCIHRSGVLVVALCGGGGLHLGFEHVPRAKSARRFWRVSRHGSGTSGGRGSSGKVLLRVHQGVAGIGPKSGGGGGSAEFGRGRPHKARICAEFGGTGTT